MIGKVVLSHGDLADELLRSAEKIVGELPSFAAVSLPWEGNSADAEERIRSAVAEVDSGHGVLILADMPGNTPCNIVRSMKLGQGVELVTGVNLPLLVRLACKPEPAHCSLHQAAERAREMATSSVKILSSCKKDEHSG